MELAPPSPVPLHVAFQGDFVHQQAEHWESQGSLGSSSATFTQRHSAGTWPPQHRLFCPVQHPNSSGRGSSSLWLVSFFGARFRKGEDLGWVESQLPKPVLYSVETLLIQPAGLRALQPTKHKGLWHDAQLLHAVTDLHCLGWTVGSQLTRRRSHLGILKC